MPSPLPHSEAIRTEVNRYLSETGKLLSGSAKRLQSSTEFRTIYKTTLAADAVLAKLTSREQPRLSVCRSILRRVPLLVAFGQVSASNIELRRFIEVVLWCVYFTEHPVEWEHFKATPKDGYVREMDVPIAFCAHRNLLFYADYAKERFRLDPSGLAVNAAADAYRAYGELSATVHPGAIAAGATMMPIIEDIDVPPLGSFAKAQRAVCAATCIMLGALLRSRFDRLPPMHRAWFDWLIGSKRKILRSGEFGLG